MPFTIPSVSLTQTHKCIHAPIHTHLCAFPCTEMLEEEKHRSSLSYDYGFFVTWTKVEVFTIAGLQSIWEDAKVTLPAAFCCVSHFPDLT